MAANGGKLGCFVLIFVVYCIAEIQAGEYCTKYVNGYYYATTYCSYGCCSGDCCDSNVGLIVGGVIGAILLVSLLVAVVCCCLKKKSYSGRVVHPAGRGHPHPSNVTVVCTGTSGQYPGPTTAATSYPPYMGTAQAPAYPPQPPAYKQFDNPPPAYPYTDPVYPPPPPPTTSAFSPPQSIPPSYPPPPPAGFSLNDQAPPSSNILPTAPTANNNSRQ